MTIYALSGLGVDARVFDFLECENPIVTLNWRKPARGESLSHYAREMSKDIDTTNDFILMGLSFGGIMALEMTRHIKPKGLLLISTVISYRELPVAYRLPGFSGLMNLIPHSLLRPPVYATSLVLGTKRMQMLREIIKDMDREFTHWALSRLFAWKGDFKPANYLRIHGDKDMLLPLRKDKNTAIIAGGSHFMIVDRAAEISRHIHQYVNTFNRNG